MRTRHWIILVVSAFFLVSFAAAPTWAQLSDQATVLTGIPDISVAATGVALIAATDVTRVNLDCTNMDGSINVRWGPQGISGSIGQRLKAGAAIQIAATAAVYMIAESGNVNVSCTKETKP